MQSVHGLLGVSAMLIAARMTAMSSTSTVNGLRSSLQSAEASHARTNQTVVMASLATVLHVPSLVAQSHARATGVTGPSAPKLVEEAPSAEITMCGNPLNMVVRNARHAMERKSAGNATLTAASRIAWASGQSGVIVEPPVATPLAPENSL